MPGNPQPKNHRPLSCGTAMRACCRQAGTLLHVGAPTSSFSSGTEAAAERFQAMGHYRIYQLDPSDHITAGFSVECGSDTAAMRAARTLLERSAGVEVWKSANRLAHLSRPAVAGPLYGTYGRLGR